MAQQAAPPPKKKGGGLLGGISDALSGAGDAVSSGVSSLVSHPGEFAGNVAHGVARTGRAALELQAAATAAPAYVPYKIGSSLLSGDNPLEAAISPLSGVLSAANHLQGGRQIASDYGAGRQFNRLPEAAQIGADVAPMALGGTGGATGLGSFATKFGRSLAINAGVNFGLEKGSEAAQDVPGWRSLSPEQQQAIIMGGTMLGGHAAGKVLPKLPGVAAAVSDRISAANVPDWAKPVLAGEEGSARADFGLGDVFKRGGSDESMPEWAKPVVEEHGAKPPAVGSPNGFSLRSLDPTALIAKGYGQLPFVRGKSGIGGLPDWMVNAPDAYDGSSLLNLKNITSDPALPTSAKLSNGVWRALTKVGGDKFSLKLEDPRVRQIRMMHDFNAQAIPAIADAEAAIHTAPIRNLPIDEAGRALTAEGKPIDFINAQGRPELYKGTRMAATWQDIAENPTRYPGALTPEQTAAIQAISERMGAIAETSRRMGIKIEGAVQPGEGGSYLSRIGTKPILREEGPVSQVGKRYEDGKAGSTLERKYKSGAAAVADGMVVPSPAESFKLYVQKNLEQQNGTHAGNLLKRVVLKDGETIGGSEVGQAAKDERAALVKGLRPQSRELRALKGTKAIADRDVRLGNAWINQAVTRGQELMAKAGDATQAMEVRQAAAKESLGLAKTQLADALSAAADLERKTGGLAKEGESSRLALKNVLDEGSRLSKRLDAVDDEMVADLSLNEPGLTDKGVTYKSDLTPKVTNLGSYLRGVQSEVEKANAYAQHVRETAATEAATIQKRLEALPYDDVTARYQDALNAAADAHARFGSTLSDARRARVDIEAAAASEPAAAERARAAMFQGRNDELTKVWRQRASQVLRAVDRSSELGQKIEELSAKMEPGIQRTKELRSQVVDVRKLAHERGQQFTGEIPLDSMRGIKVPGEMVNAWTKTMATPPGTGAQVFDLVNNSFRMLGATADASRAMTVGLLGNADNPLIGSRAFGSGVRAALNEDAAWNQLRGINAKAVAEGLPSISEAIGKDGLMLAESEYSLGNAAKPGSFADWFSKRPGIKQADALYTAPGNYERVSRYYKTLGELKAAGKDWTSPQVRESAANAANLISGRARNGVLSPIIGTEAANRVAFAGRFVQSQFETVANAALSGGIEGYEARKALLRLSLGVGAVTFAINHALGNDTILDPGDSNFLAIRIAGTDYKLGGAYQSLLAGVWKAAHEAGDSFVAKDPRGVINAPADLIRSKAGPLAGIGYDVTLGHGKNPIGDSWKSGLNPAPFGFRDIATQAQRNGLDFDPTSLGALALASTASLTGVRANPLTPTEELDQAVGDMFSGKDYASLSPAQQDQVRVAHPDLWQAKVDAGSADSRQYYARKDELTAEQRASDAARNSGQITNQEWVAQYRARQTRLAEAGYNIFGAKGIKEHPTKAQEFYGNFIESAKNPDGSIRWDEVDAKVAGLPQAMQDSIEESHSLGSTPVVRQYKAAQALHQEMQSLPKYRGYTGEEANAIDAAYAHLPTGTARQKLRALTALGIDDPRTLRGVRARILGTIGKQLTTRDRFKKANPAIGEFYGAGDFTGSVAA